MGPAEFPGPLCHEPSPEIEERTCVLLEEDWEVDSPQELSQGEEGTDPSWGSEEEMPPVRPRVAWAEHGSLHPCTATGPAPALPSRAPHSRGRASTPYPAMDRSSPSPSPSQLEDLGGQGAGAEAELCPSEAPSKDGSCSEELRSVCSSSGLSTEWAEDTQQSRSTGEESGSGSFPCGSWAEDTHLSWSSEEESSSGPLPWEAWAEDGDLSGSVAGDSGSVSLPSELWSQSSGQTAAVPMRRPSLFRRALRALRRAFGSLRHLPGLQA